MTDIDDVPVVQSQPEFVSSNVVINSDTVDDSESPIPESKPPIEKMSTSQKWEKYKVNINKKEGVNTGVIHHLLKQSKEKHTRTILYL